MTSRPTTVERAFQLAQQGQGAAEIKKRLSEEGYSDAAAQLSGPSIKSQLRKLCSEALSNAEASGDNAAD